MQVRLIHCLASINASVKAQFLDMDFSGVHKASVTLLCIAHKRQRRKIEGEESMSGFAHGCGSYEAYAEGSLWRKKAQHGHLLDTSSRISHTLTRGLCFKGLIGH